MNGRHFQILLVLGLLTLSGLFSPMLLFTSFPNREISRGVDGEMVENTKPRTSAVHLAQYANATFLGEAELDSAGFSVAWVGDVNGDGREDLLVGTPQYASSPPGKAYLIYGSEGMNRYSGWSLSNANASFIGISMDSNTGFSVAGAGDVNGDGFADMIIGAPYESGSRGMVYLIFGNRSMQLDTPISVANVTFRGISLNDQAGYSIAGAGDVNGDGYADILIGAYNAHEGNGSAYLIYGDKELAPNQILNNANVTFEAETPIGSGSYVGDAVAGVGDINRDGFDDVLISAPNANSFRGKAYIIFGSPSLSGSINLVDADGSFIGEFDNDMAGYGVAGIGDVNNDGFMDFAIGAPYNNEAFSGAGQVYLIYGNASYGLNTPLNQANASILGELTNDAIGSVIAGLGDVNRDGYEDFAIGSPLYNSSSGRGYVFFGSPDLHADMSVTEANLTVDSELANSALGSAITGMGDGDGDGWIDVVISANWYDNGRGKIYLFSFPQHAIFSNVTFSTTSNNVNLGRACAGIGDTNGDGWDDFLISSNLNSNGSIHLYYGNGSYPTSITDGAANATFFGENDGDSAGHTVARCGDVNGDGLEDFLISSMGFPAGSYQGKTYLFYGSRIPFEGNYDLGTSANASFLGENTGDSAGTAICGGEDVNRDGLADIFISASTFSGNRGKVYLIYGNQSMQQDTPLSVANASFLGENGNDGAGSSIACAGDLNRDGYDDFLIGANGYPAGQNRGRVYVIYGNGSLQQDTNLAAANASFEGEFNGDYAGQFIANAGDLNRDGFNDILITAQGSDYGAPNGGKIYIIHGNGSLQPNTNLNAANASFYGTNIYDYVGWGVAGLGDVNKDGFDDFIVGSNASQKFFVILGNGSLHPNTHISAANISIPIKNPFLLSFPYGLSSAGDINRDGQPDILLATPEAGADNEGEAYLVVDWQAPGAITNFAGVTAAHTPSSIMLQWTAPGDDDSLGTVAGYILKYTTIWFSEEQFDVVASYDTSGWINFQPGSLVEMRNITGLPEKMPFYFRLKAFDNAGRCSSISDCVGAATLDGTPPGQITDLLVSETAETSVNLTWTAPADDGYFVTSGNVNGYFLRYSTAPITSENFDTATNYDTSAWNSDLKSVNEIEKRNITGLVSGCRYYFALKARDHATPVNLNSSMSNVAVGITLDFTLPALNSPQDLTYEVGKGSGVNIGWLPTDYVVLDPTYNITINGSLHGAAGQIWTHDTLIIFDVGDWEEGTYIIVLTIDDGLGNIASDTVIVTVTGVVPGDDNSALIIALSIGIPVAIIVVLMIYIKILKPRKQAKQNQQHEARTT